MTRKEDDDTDPRGLHVSQVQNMTREQLLNMVNDSIAAIEFDLDVLTQGFGLLMKAHNLERQWKNLQRHMSERRRHIDGDRDTEPPKT